MTQNRINTLFANKTLPILSVYCTAGFPALNDTVQMLEALQSSGVQMIEIGMPFSDPVADGEVIQESSAKALQNGMTTELLFTQLKNIREKITIPLVLMGYVNPVIQYGLERFCEDCARVGIDGIILPDLPLEVFEEEWQPHFQKHNLHHILLITPQTPESRIARIDKVSGGFLYAVSSAGTTGGALTMDEGRMAYFLGLRELKAKGIISNPVMIGFGIHDKASFDAASEYADGAIIGSAFIRAIANKPEGMSIDDAVRDFICTIR